MTRSHIIYTGPFDPRLCDGVSSSFHDLLGFFHRAGHEVSIISLMHTSPETEYLLHHFIDQLDAEMTRRGEKFCNFFWNGIHVHYELLPHTRDEVLHGHKDALKRYVEKIGECPGGRFFTTDIDSTAIVAHSVAGTRADHYIHSPAVTLDYLKNNPNILRLLRKRTLYTVSDFSKQQFRLELGLEPIVWPPFIDAARVRCMRRPARRMVVGFYSAGVHKGERIIEQVIRSMPETSFVVMGQDDSALGRYPNVTVLGRTSNMNDFYGVISVLVVPSVIAEGYSRVVLEAAINEIPVIANAIGGIPEAIGDSGILVDINPDQDALATEYVQILTRLRNDAEFYSELCRKASRRAGDYLAGIQSTSLSNITAFPGTPYR